MPDVSFVISRTITPTITPGDRCEIGNREWKRRTVVVIVRHCRRSRVCILCVHKHIITWHSSLRRRTTRTRRAIREADNKMPLRYLRGIIVQGGRRGFVLRKCALAKAILGRFSFGTTKTQKVVFLEPPVGERGVLNTITTANQKRIGQRAGIGQRWWSRS